MIGSNSIVLKLAGTERFSFFFFLNWSTLEKCCEIQRRVAEQIVMSPLGSCNKVIFLLHFA